MAPVVSRDCGAGWAYGGANWAIGERAVYDQEKDEHSCPLRFQTGALGVKDFDALIERLSPDQRDEFETERAERQAELDRYVATFGYRT